jgi:hypothetical protein
MKLPNGGWINAMMAQEENIVCYFADNLKL